MVAEAKTAFPVSYLERKLIMLPVENSESKLRIGFRLYVEKSFRAWQASPPETTSSYLCRLVLWSPISHYAVDYLLASASLKSMLEM